MVKSGIYVSGRLVGIFSRWTKIELKCPVESELRVGECMIEVEVLIKHTVPHLMPAAGLCKVSVYKISKHLGTFLVVAKGLRCIYAR